MSVLEHILNFEECRGNILPYKRSSLTAS